MTYSRRDPRRAIRDLDPDPAEVLTKRELVRAGRIREVHRLAVYWHLDPSEVKRRLFVGYLIDTKRMGKGDRA
jgi:hypothetical protein